MEATLLAAKCRESGCLYEATLCLISLWRAILHAWTRAKELGEDDSEAFFSDLHARARQLVIQSADLYLVRVEEARPQSGDDLASCIGTGTGTMGALILTYPVECARWIEMMGLRYFLLDQGKKAKEKRVRSRFVARLVNFISKESGCVHPVSERYAVSSVWPVLALSLEGETALATSVVRKTATWLGDRHQRGKGLARIEASTDEEAHFLLGSSFEFFDSRRSPSSLMASALADLAAWLDDTTLYEDIVNDWMSLDICPTFYAPCDSEGVFRFDASDVLQYPNMVYSRTHLPFKNLDFAPHMAGDPQRYKLSDQVGREAFIAVSLLLRDRYFPRLWPEKL